MVPPGGATLNMLEANYDAKKYTHGPPWYGDRNQQFRAWQEQYTTRVGDEVDDDCGLDDMYLGTDPQCSEHPRPCSTSPQATIYCSQLLL